LHWHAGNRTFRFATGGEHLGTGGLLTQVCVQAIDGAALLLLTRELLTAMHDIPLGYALKLSAHLQILREAMAKL
jgi:hypothetical protein